MTLRALHMPDQWAAAEMSAAQMYLSVPLGSWIHLGGALTDEVQAHEDVWGDGAACDGKGSGLQVW